MSKKYCHIVTNNYVSVMNLETGKTTKISKTEEKFERAVALLKEGKFEDVEKLNEVLAVEKYSDGKRIKVGRGAVWYVRDDGSERPLHGSLIDRLIKMRDQGFDVLPLTNFLERLMLNPSKTAVDELFLFMEPSELPITSDGFVIAYKMVREDYTSIHDSKFMNKVGTWVSMDRNEVDENRDRTCSVGLHFCSKAYLNSYGSGNSSTDRLLLLKIDPADVVSIPSDYNNAKGRACRYYILQDITEEGWRKTIGKEDFTKKAVYDGPEDPEDTHCTHEKDDAPLALTIENIRKLVEDYFQEDISDMPNGANIFYNGFDDLNLIEMVMLVEENYEIEIPDEVSSRISTLDQLFNAAKAAKEADPAVDTLPVQCPHCSSTKVIKKGKSKDGLKQRHKCNFCGTYFSKAINGIGS